MDDQLRSLVFQAIDQTISDEDFDRLQDAIEKNESVRSEYLRAVNLCESLGEIASEEQIEPPANDLSSQRARPRLSPALFAIAAMALVLVAGIAFWFGQQRILPTSNEVAVDQQQTDESVESLVAGHATLRRSVDLQWANDAASFHEGDLLPDGPLRFTSGVAEIDFFCGATLIVEGPASLVVESDWSVHVIHGRLRANVPPAARGFVVKAADSEIVDLGTEFALDVSRENARVEVIDGEVKLVGGEHDGNHLTTGQRRWLLGAQGEPTKIEDISTTNDIARRRDGAESERFAEWKETSAKLKVDERLIAYYPIAEAQSERSVLNAATTGSGLDGLLVGPVHRTKGRFGVESAGLEFDRPGSRVRTRIDGEFQAFTFMCWARIDSLEHRYNSLFMSDGYENGELHWQIRDDGCMMFSVMVDDSQEVKFFNETDQRVVQDAGLHRVYFTDPIWDVSKSGQWFHLAAVYDPISRQVKQYVNGDKVSGEEISDKFHVTKLRIGPSEIGNWGQPFRETPWFAVRNLNGTIDELAIFNAALEDAEVKSLYEQGKPLGY